ncbi:MAG: Na+/H+ antiporter NhaC family protein [Planctomycetes bacterium]|nr:Na+/H+ antiporter NhaC family protein [Planctomycetota bacterium]
MRAHRIFSLLFLLIASWSLPLRAQEPAPRAPSETVTWPADFRTTFDSDRPLLPIRDKDNRMLPPGLATVTIEALDDSGNLMEGFSGSARIQGASRAGKIIETAGPFSKGVFRLEKFEMANGSFFVENKKGFTYKPVLPGWLTLLPPLTAIILAFLTRQVLVALFCGVWVGACFSYSLHPIRSFLYSIDTYIVGALSDTDHAIVILFSFGLAGTIGVITYIGGIRGIVEIVSTWARGPRSGQVATWFLGLFIFFDDYANSLIIGNTMRPFTDKVRVSREKLAFIVDSTAAPVATIGVISTWTAFQIGLVAQEESLKEQIRDPYLFFLESIPYSFYSILTLFLVLICGLTLRDFGPMRVAEERCRKTGKVLRDGAKPLFDDTMAQLGDADDLKPRWINAVLPISCVIAFTLIGLYTTGIEALGAEAATAGLGEVIQSGNSFNALLWGTMGASMVAILMALGQGFPLDETISSWISGARSIVLALITLLLAWSIGAVCKDIQTGAYVASISGGILTPQILPLVAFISAAIIALATGTSYGTMGLLVPIFLGQLIFPLAETAGIDPETTRHLALALLAAILGGAVFGDHCSPISDTTVLSSMASGADHIDHVKTQLPYAMLTAGICVPIYLLVGFAGLGPALVLPIGLVAVFFAFRALSKDTGSVPQDNEASDPDQAPEA